MDVTGMDGPLVGMVFTVCTLLSLVYTLAMCVCVKNKKSKTDDTELAQVNGSAKKKKSGRTVGATEVEMRDENTQSNGSVPHDNINRPKSHEDRALPDIPGGGDGLQTDEDEETDAGHYDIISRTQRTSNQLPLPVAGGTNDKRKSGGKGGKDVKNAGKKKNHPYEEVTGSGVTVEGDTDSTTYAVAGATSLAPGRDPTYAAVSEKSSELDPTYAGVTDDTSTDDTYAGVKDSQSESSLGGGSSGYAVAGKGSHPYATVLNIGEAEYAQITEKKSTKKKSMAGGSAAAKKKSMVTRDTMDSIATPPPVPDKVLDPSEIRLQQAGSPNLPPRNTGVSAFDGSHMQDIPFADEGTPSLGNSPQHQVNQGYKQNTGVDPPYSAVTARESLGELRRRLETAPRLTATPSALNYNYEPMDYQAIDYEMVKTPGVSSSIRPSGPALPLQAGDRNSLSSDLYAEIGNTLARSASGRSETYAQVCDLPLQVARTPAGTHAPTPPPLSHLPKRGDEAERGSCSSTGSSNYHTVQEVEYAVVDKSLKRKRQTVHIMENNTSSAYNSGHLGNNTGGHLVGGHLGNNTGGHLGNNTSGHLGNNIGGHLGNNIGGHLVNSGDHLGNNTGGHLGNNNNTGNVSTQLQPEGGNEHLYSKVDKSAKRNQDVGGMKRGNVVYDNQSMFSYEGTGARPKLTASASSVNNGHDNNDKRNSGGHKRNHSKGGDDGSYPLNQSEQRYPTSNSVSYPAVVANNNNVGDNTRSQRSSESQDRVNSNVADPRGMVAPGYQTIGGVILPPGDPILDDPDYDTVEDRMVVIPSSEHDPNYESLPGSGTGIALSAFSVAAATNTNSASMETPRNPAVVRGTAQNISISADGSSEISLVPVITSLVTVDTSLVHESTHRGNPAAWARREHIYQEIQDAKNENIYTPDPTSHPPVRRGRGGGGGGDQGGSPEQYVTNL